MAVEVVAEIGVVVVVVIEMGTEEKEETSEAVIGEEVAEEEGEDIDEATPQKKLTIRDLLENLVPEGIGQTVVGTETAEKEVTGAIGETAIKIVQTGLVIEEEEEVAVVVEEKEETETGLVIVVLIFLPMHRSRLHQERCAAQQPNSSFQLICRS